MPSGSSSPRLPELDAVVVNPTTPVGDGDRKPTPTGRMIAGVARDGSAATSRRPA